MSTCQPFTRGMLRSKKTTSGRRTPEYRPTPREGPEQMVSMFFYWDICDLGELRAL
jgi:hypothetical protein